MNTIVTGRHIEITDPIRQHVADKTAKLPRYYDRLSKLEVIADKSDTRTYQIELIAHVDGAEHFVAQATDTDLYHCIELAVQKMERQLTDHKEKLRNHKHHA